MSFPVIMLVPTATSVNLTSTTLGVLEAFKQHQIPVHGFKAVGDAETDTDGADAGFEILDERTPHTMIAPIPHAEVENYIANDKTDDLLEEIVKRFEQNKIPNSLTVVEGISVHYKKPYSRELNRKIATAIGADIIFVTSPKYYAQNRFNDHVAAMCPLYDKKRTLGAIVTNTSAPLDADGKTPKIGGGISVVSHALSATDVQACPVFKGLPILGVVEYENTIEQPRPIDIARHINADILHAGDMEHRRITGVEMAARTLTNSIGFLQSGNLVFTPVDRTDIMMATALSASVGKNIGTLALTGDTHFDEHAWDLCQPAFAEHDVPVIRTAKSAWEVSRAMTTVNAEIPKDDLERIQHVCDYYASCIDKNWITNYLDTEYKTPLSPPAFKYQLIERAKANTMTIALPEGDEPRTVQAAKICADKGIAHCILIGNADTIKTIATENDVDLDHPNITLCDHNQPNADYINRLVELRGHKGMTEELAKSQLQDPITYATMMIDAGHADGLVAGAVNTTANTIRPPLQIIKTAPNSSIVSSIFFMCLPEQVLVYGDCAINPNPNAEQLAEIAIQSADSATAFGITPKVAMISYSTGQSGSGDEVEKVRTATDIVREKRPDIIIDGPLQYDAAVMESVAKSKAPNSPVAGQATVFIFPDLNTGNTTYKAVQRSAKCISIGPMLQGMKKPVNDLSRGALVDDIVYTIALTAIQSQNS